MAEQFQEEAQLGRTQKRGPPWYLLCQVIAEDPEKLAAELRWGGIL